MLACACRSKRASLLLSLFGKTQKGNPDLLLFQNMRNQSAWLVAVGALLLAMVLAVTGCSPQQRQGESRRDEPPAGSEREGSVEASAAGLLPDVDPTAPTGLRIGADGSGGFQLSFDATFDNIGAGPLHIDGHRPNTSGRMVADQVITRSDGSTRLNPGVGQLRFVESEDHRHWHFFRFMRYELVRAADGAVVAPDQKTGFCIGDRYNTDPRVRLPGEPSMPGVFDVPPDNDWCAQNDPDRLKLTMGLSVGYGDNYLAFLDGQSIDVNDVPEGSYYLVHRVEADVWESDYSNNAASVLLKLGWPNGVDNPPAIMMLASCAQTARCSPGEHQPPPR